MFAVAVWDARERKLVLARDRLGQKPLFYTLAAGGLAFASELKGLLAAGRTPAEVELESVHHYLSLRFVPSPRTMLRHVFQLPPGHRLVFRGGAARVERYWRLDFRDKLDGGDGELLERVAAKLDETVATHLVSDVEVGAFLSGGLDSSTVVARLVKAGGGDRPGDPPRTFAVGVAGAEVDERPWARRVAEHLGTRHHDRSVAPELASLLPRLVRCLDEPSDPIAACMLHAAELASEWVKVVLGGDGGDEGFAGFDRYLGVPRAGVYGLLPAPLRSLLGGLVDRLPGAFGYKSVGQKLRWLHRVGGVRDLPRRYAEATCCFRFGAADKRRLYGDGPWRHLAELDSEGLLAHTFAEAPASNDLDRMLSTDYLTRLPGHSLMLTDRTTMAYSLEQRSPFLDHELVELLAALPPRLKIRGGELKWALRRLAEADLPADVVRRPKHGFMLPVAEWLRGPLRPAAEGILGGSRLVAEGAVRRSEVRRLLDEHRARRHDHHTRLWMLMNLEVWHRLYVEGWSVDRAQGWIEEVSAESRR
jgi:asparagine synthase (glutamine-hydrolysing)